jgi:hypothetical protein
MSNGAIYGASGSAAGAAAVHAAIANAIKASGAIVKVENRDFLTLLDRAEKPLVVMAGKGFLSPSYKYLFSYKGLAFYTKSSEQLRLPISVELIMAKSIWIPS